MSSSPLEIDCRSVKAKLDQKADFLFLDCREKTEYDTVHIAEATLLPMSEMQARIAELEDHKNKEIVVHCHHGGRSAQVAMFLERNGFKKIFNLAGGVDGWARQVDNGMATY